MERPRKERNTAEIKKIVQEKGTRDPSCNLCQEIGINIGEVTPYGAVIIARIGTIENGWFATLSPKTGGDPLRDCTIQIMPFTHITQFSQLAENPQLAGNYGILLSKVSRALFQVMAEEEQDFKADSLSREASVSLATYGKTTTWKEKKEHLHIKIFPFRGKHGQPATVDSSFERKRIYQDQEGEFVKMDPIKKAMLSSERKRDLAERMISILKIIEKS
ncbi:MAG TPA: hypothetical protein VJI15_00570 [Candidatus Nanoarchaeia archaeon]|nr:hypothetical protein [Candidatus Nanoarchaeia archaeon]